MNYYSVTMDDSEGDLAEAGKSNGENAVKVHYLDTPVKSENDKKDYRVIKLPNGLTALLISDLASLSSDKINNDEEKDDYDKCNKFSTTDKENVNEKENESEEENDQKVTGDSTNGDVDSAQKFYPRQEMSGCSLCVGVGSFSDPSEIPGLAHFLEHMVFMGSEKYPEENDFDDFLNEHGGYRDATTECESTTFRFDISEKSLLPALDRFAQYFISPLLKREAMTRQREVVDSEFRISRSNDIWRAEQIFCTLAEPGHPATKFKEGNLATLQDNVQDDKLYEALVNFRKRYYSAHRMTLAVQARLPLDTLEEYVKDCFATVPSNGLPADDFTQFEGIRSFDTTNFHRIYKIKPVADNREVELSWTLPPVQHLYKCKPHEHVAWILGHEGNGSLINYLRKKMWCLDDACGVTNSSFADNSMYTLFQASFVLTDDGLEHLKDVLDAIFSFIALMRVSGPQKRIHDEMKQIAENSFRFQEEVSPASYCEDLTKEMQLWPPRDYITGRKLFFEYNQTEIKACMDALTPDGVSIVIFDKKFNDAEFEKVEPWFNTKYTETEIPRDWIEHWQEIEPYSEFHLPEQNIFIADDFSLVPLPEDVPEYPTKIHSDSMSEVWFRPDPKFRKPECCMDYYLISPLNSASPQNSAASDLMVLVLQKLLDTELYPATRAGLHHECCSWDKGIIVTLKGFNQKMPVSLATIMCVIADCPKLISEDMFDTLKAQQRNAYYEQFKKPEDLAGAVKWSILELVHWGVVQKHVAISELDFTQFVTFITRFVDHIYLKCLVQGNTTKKAVIENTQNCLDILKCRPTLAHTLAEHRATQLPLGAHCCRLKNFNKADTTSVMTNYYQSSIGTPKTAAIIDLIVMLMGAPLFNQLVIQEQLGYNASCTMQDANGILGYSITLCPELDKFTMEHVDERIEAFVRSFTEHLCEMTAEELNDVKSSLLKFKRLEDCDLETENYRNWIEILYSDYTFDRRSGEISAINGTTLADLRDWMEKHVSGGPNLRKLSIQIVGHPREKGEVGNYSTKGKDKVENSEETMETSEIHVNGNADTRDSSLDHTDHVKWPMEFLTEMPNEKTIKPPDYYVTDIQRFKNSLYAFPAFGAST